MTNRIYVANYNANSVSVIEGATNRVVATVGVGGNPYRVAVNPQTNRVYVTNYGGSSVSVIDGAADQVVAVVAVAPYPIGIGVNPLTNRIYAASRDSGTVAVIDGATNAVVATVVVNIVARGLGVVPETNRAYVAPEYGGGVPVRSIDLATNTVVGSAVLTCQYGKDDVAVNPRTGRVYTAHPGCGSVGVIQSPQDVVYAEIAFPANTQAVGVDPLTNRAFVAGANGRLYALNDTAIVADVAVGRNPRGVGVNPQTSLVYVSNFDDNTVSVVNEFVNTIIDTGPVGPTNDNTPTFTFHATVPNTAFECAADAGAFSDCTTPHTLPTLSDGPHTFSVRAREASGELDPTPATRQLTIDTLPPDTEITSGPPPFVGRPSVQFGFTANEPASFECAVAGSPFEPCASPKSYDALPDGTHTF